MLPQHMRADDPTAADPARRRLLQKSPFRFPSLPSRSSKISLNSLQPPAPDHLTDDILVHDPNLTPSSRDKDVFRWAVLYENQRGITLFSTPLYSPHSLLPSDPQPFTLPNTRHSYPNLSLDNYSLPDGTWRWVSTAWMVDMRADHGEVQHDGFEYNWSFRDSSWRAKIGKLSAGAWVRRRRWVRLMMRPAVHTHNGNHTTTIPSRSSSPPSFNLSSFEFDHTSHRWDGSERDWQHLQRLIKHLGRDGRQLELWRMWLGPFPSTHTTDIKGKGKQSDAPPLSLQRALEKRLPDVDPPPPAHLITILKNHGEAILRSFVFPDSRARFVELTRRAGLARDLESCLGRAFSTADVDFSSYADNLNRLVHTD